jgi:hypothetical protein
MGWSFEVHISMLEIYNEGIRDLLPDQATPKAEQKDFKFEVG